MSFTDPYLYLGTHVLQNKAGIYDEQALREFEYEHTKWRMDELRERPIAGKFDLEHLKAIHAHIFQDVYDWAE
jgi:cell filamentation protein